VMPTHISVQATLKSAHMTPLRFFRCICFMIFYCKIWELTLQLNVHSSAFSLVKEPILQGHFAIKSICSVLCM